MWQCSLNWLGIVSVTSLHSRVYHYCTQNQHATLWIWLTVELHKIIRRCEHFLFKGASNTTKLGYLNHYTKLFNHQHGKMTGLAYFRTQCKRLSVLLEYFNVFQKILCQFEDGDLQPLSEEYGWPSPFCSRAESNMLKNLPKMLPGISPKIHLLIMLLSAPIMLALCSQVANNS